MSEPIRILCVDDEIGVLKAISRLFLDEDYEILTANSGPEGLKILEGEASLQVVISDLKMPDMDGSVFLQEVLRRRPETIRMVLSGSGDTSLLVDAVNLGKITRFIPKPWVDEEFKAILSDVAAHLCAAPGKPSDPEEASLGHRPRNTGLPLPRSILEALPMALMEIAAEGCITQLNPRARALFNGQGEILPGQDRRAVLPEEINVLIDKIVEQGTGAHHIRLNGETFHLVGETLGQGKGLVLAFI